MNKSLKGIQHYYSEVESKRFNRKVFRYIISEELKFKELFGMIDKDQPDLAIIRINTKFINDIIKIKRISNDLILADTLVYYIRDNIKVREPDVTRNKNISLIEARIEDINQLNEMTEKIFFNYYNHYTINNQIEDFNLTDAYKEWVEGYISTDNRKCYLVKLENDIVGFATIKWKDNIGEGVLYGVLPEYRGKGVYRDIIKLTIKEFIKLNCEKVIVSTQIDNIAVQKTWVKEGFSPYESYYTIHLNLFNSYFKDTKNIIYKESFIADDDRIKKFAEVSGDFNPIHINSNYAKKAGFIDRILHGGAVISYISKILGMNYPGQGTIIIKQFNEFFSPIVINKEYEIQLFEPNKKAIYRKIYALVKEKHSNNIIMKSIYHLKYDQ